MPFKSKAQQRYMYSNNPKLAEEFAKYMDSKDFSKLPEKKESKTKSKKKRSNKKNGKRK